MINRYTFFVFVSLVVCMLACSQEKSSVTVIDFSKRETREAILASDLDSVYTNLLGTEKDEAEADSLYNDWMRFNAELADLIRDKKFDWGSEDSSIILWNRVYCDGGGKINYYLYFIRDSLVNETAKERYGAFIEENIASIKYPVKRDFKYFQCGSYRHKNY